MTTSSKRQYEAFTRHFTGVHRALGLDPPDYTGALDHYEALLELLSEQARDAGASAEEQGMARAMSKKFRKEVGRIRALAAQEGPGALEKAEEDLGNRTGRGIKEALQPPRTNMDPKKGRIEAQTVLFQGKGGKRREADPPGPVTPTPPASSFITAKTQLVSRKERMIME